VLNGRWPADIVVVVVELVIPQAVSADFGAGEEL
jgi:hypothetical protein